MCKIAKGIKCAFCCALLAGAVLAAAKTGLFDRRKLKRKLKKKIDCLEDALECAEDFVSDI